jgi:trans-aconitate methyltransferase
MRWNRAQDLKFADHRLRPTLDLLAPIPAENPKTIIVFGCGPGNFDQPSHVVARQVAQAGPSRESPARVHSGQQAGVSAW